jgi:hypothetical protein
MLTPRLQAQAGMAVPMNYRPSDYPCRQHRTFSEDKFLTLLVDRLQELEQRTHPKDGLKSAKGKDDAALKALELAGVLVSVVAGWAIDHAAGLALEGLTFVPRAPHGEQDRPVFREAAARADNHRHERNGNINKAKLAPLERIRFLLNLLEGDCMAGIGWDLSRELLFEMQSRVYDSTNPSAKNDLATLKLPMVEVLKDLPQFSIDGRRGDERPPTFSGPLKEPIIQSFSNAPVKDGIARIDEIIDSILNKRIKKLILLLKFYGL